MTDVAIRVEGLSKRYRIGSREASYKTLREAVTDAALSPFRKVRFLAKHNGHATEEQSVSSLAPDSSPLPLTPLPNDTIWALKDVSFEVKRGEVLGIIGRNGAGKSTLLKILSRITEPTEGYADINGRVGSLLEVGTGFHPELTGRENIFLNGAVLGMKKAEIERRFDEIVAFAEVEKFVDTPVKRYSSGMYLRLAFAVAAHLEPEILVVDEVLAVGDTSFQSKCLNKMQDVAGIGRTVLFVSHNMGAIHRLCSRCILLNEGQLLDDGVTDTVIEHYIAKGFSQRPEYLQATNPDKPINLRRACLTDLDGNIASEFRYDEGFRIAIEYEVNRPMNECSIWLGVRTAEEVWAFNTADTDLETTGSSVIGRRRPGFYKTSVDVPARWLNGGRYYVVVGIGRLGSRISYDRIEMSGFTVMSVGVPEQGRPGVLQPFLEWVTEEQKTTADTSPSGQILSLQS